MINVGNLVLKAWYELLGDSVAVNGANYNVYRYDAPPTEDKSYILLRLESNSDRSNNHHNVSTVVVITEVVTIFKARINDALAGDIDSAIATLLSSRAATHNLPRQSGIGVTKVTRESGTYLPEDDGANRYLRLVTRNVHRVEQEVSLINN